MRYRAGLLGAAKIAPKAFITPAIARGDIDIVAVGCRSGDKAQRFITGHKLTQARATDYASVCSDPDIDIVYCALPPSAHLHWVTLALESGKAVLVEKPFALSADEARQMAAVSKASGSFLMEGYHYCFHAAFHFVQSQINAGTIGRVTGFSGEFSHPIPNRPGELRYNRGLGGGALMDLGCYPLHAFRQIVGEPVILSAKAEREIGVDVSMRASVSCGEVSGDILCDMRADASGVVAFTVSGTRGTIVFDNFVSPHTGHTLTVTADGTRRAHALEGRSTYRAQLDSFIAALCGEDCVLQLSDSIMQMAAMDAIYSKAGFSPA